MRTDQNSRSGRWKEVGEGSCRCKTITDVATRQARALVTASKTEREEGDESEWDRNHST
jgi:hypothetical protein